MNRDINLIQESGAGSQKQAGVVKKLQTIATVFTLSVGFLSVALFLLNRQLSPTSIRAQQASVLSNITLLAPKQAKILVLSLRLNDISTILQRRTKYDQILGAIFQNSPTSLSINSLSLSKGLVNLTVSANSLLSINQFIDNLTDMTIKKQFIKTLTIDSLVLNSRTGGYLLSLKLDLL